MTFQDQCMKVVFPRFIEGINAANRRARDLEARIESLHNRLDAVAASLERLNGLFGKEVQEVNGEAGDLRVQVNDLLDRVNALEARVPEKKPRKPRAKKQDPVQSVEEAAKRAAVDKAMDAVLEDAARRESVVSMPEPGTYQTAGTAGRAGVYGTAGETKTVGISGTAELPPDMQGIF